MVDLGSGPDTCIWSLDISGLFSVGVTRRYIDAQLLPTLPTSTRWSTTLPRKVNVFMWRLLLDRLPHRVNLSARGLEINSISCPVCDGFMESSDHLFFFV